MLGNPGFGGREMISQIGARRCILNIEKNKEV
jgi:hypothetical protein